MLAPILEEGPPAFGGSPAPPDLPYRLKFFNGRHALLRSGPPVSQMRVPYTLLLLKIRDNGVGNGPIGQQLELQLARDGIAEVPTRAISDLQYRTHGTASRGATRRYRKWLDWNKRQPLARTTPTQSGRK